jgi:carboxyl-terminal processing protease
MTNDEFYRAMDEAIARLGDDHSVFLSPEAVRAEEEEYAGNLDYVGIGVMLSAVPERNGAVVLAVFADSPAADAGLQVGDAILTVDGMPILDADGYLTSLLRGPAETPVTIALQTPGGDPRPVTVTRRRITGSMPVPYQVFASPQGLRIGYIVLITFSDSTIDEQFGDALEAMTADAPLDGLIVDNRPNSGGADTVLKGVLSYITHGEMGKFISRDQTRTLTVLRKRDIGGSQTLPLVVLVGEDTISYGEVFAGILKDINRAYLIGQTTLGNVETLWGYDFPDGSRAWIAHESFRPLNHPDENWELTGIIPNLTVPVDWSVYLTVQDPAIQAALKFFDQR